MYVRRPSGDYYADFGENHPWVAINHSGSSQDDLLTEKERREERKRRREALARKRPAGFTAVWEDGDEMA